MGRKRSGAGEVVEKEERLNSWSGGAEQRWNSIIVVRRSGKGGGVEKQKEWWSSVMME